MKTLTNSTIALLLLILPMTLNLKGQEQTIDRQMLRKGIETKNFLQGRDNFYERTILSEQSPNEISLDSQKKGLGLKPSIMGVVPGGSQQVSRNETGTVADIDGNVYQTVLIGDRWWMAENLKVGKYRNGDIIPDGTGLTSYEGEVNPQYYFYYNHDSSYEAIYGKYYTWHVVNDPRKVCPDGWYLPTKQDWENLRDYLDPNAQGWDNIAGGKMKTTGTIDDGTGLWYSPNLGATNESGFSSNPGGFFNTDSFQNFLFYMMGERASFMSSTEVSQGWSWGASNNYDVAYIAIYSNHSKVWGANVRCIKNSTENPGPPSVFTSDAEDVTTYTAKISGVITSNGGVSVANRGFYWGENPTPSESDNKLYLGSGNGYFEHILDNLRPNTTYYYRAYAKNDVGEALGEIMSFTSNPVTESVAILTASSSFNNYWQAIKLYNISMTAAVMADHTTCSWGNFGWRDQSWEPRIEWNNSPYYLDANMTRDLWSDLYSLLLNVNDVIHAINVEGLQIGTGGVDNSKILATLYFIRGASLGQLGLTFDKAWIANDYDLPHTKPLSPWQEVIEAAINDFEMVVSISSSNTFTWIENVVNGMTIDNTYLAQLSNSYAARFLTLGARNQTQNDNLSWTSSYDWNDVLEFTNNGITVDFAPVGNGLPWEGGSWWDLNIKYLRQPGWGRVDMRVVNLLDPSQPVRYPTDSEGLPTVGTPPNNGLAVSNDARLQTDFQYLPTNDFLANRGGWHFSHYRHSRYDYPATTNTEGLYMGESLGPLRELRAYDNELMKAEALLRTGNVSAAAEILNNTQNPRKSRGQLPDIAVETEAVLNAIFYEREIELFHNGYLISYCDMRRRDMLQQGTPLHLPVPGLILSEIGEEVYTFGGYYNADGVNTSNGGDWIKPYYHFEVENTLTVVISPEGSGTVVIDPLQDYYPIGATITLEASPEEGYTFQNWQKSGTIIGENPVLIYTMPAENVTLTANFALIQPPTYTLTLIANPAEGGTVSGSGEYEEGASVEVSATAAEGYLFVSWTDLEGTVLSEIATYTFSMPANNLTLIANFAAIPPTYILSLIANPAEGGTVSGAGEYEEGASVGVSATTAEGYEFISWTDVEGTVLSETETYTFSMPAENLTLTANFAAIPPPTYTLSLNANPAEGGTVSGAGEYEEGASVEVSATAAEGYEFVSWTNAQNEVVSQTSGFTYTMPAEDVTLTANFTLIPTYSVTFIVMYGENYIEDATVTFNEQTYTTNAQGVSIIEGVANGTYPYFVVKVGYDDATGIVVVNGADVEEVVNFPVGVIAENMNAIRVYPNPFDNSFTCENATGISRVVITNLIGQRVREIHLSGQAKETIATGELSQGIYLVEFHATNGLRVIRKMVKR